MGLNISSVYVHSAICETYVVQQYSIDVLSIGVRDICILSKCVFCYMCNVFGVMVFQRSIVNWSLGIDVSSVYVHSAICDTYLV